MLQVTDTGIIIDNLADVHKRLTDGFKRIYGDDINLDADSPDGQMIGLFSQEIDNVNQAIGMIAQMLDPYKAAGAWLEQRAMYAGIVRRGADYSYADEVIFTGGKGITVPKNSVLIDANRQKWLTVDEIQLNDNGSARANIRSVERGPFALQAEKELKLETVTIGIDRIVTTTASKEGMFEESDGDLLVRFMVSHSLNNYDDKQGLEGALLDLPDIKQARVYENFTGQTDKKGIPPHSLNAVVIGGADDDIALTILKKKIGGCGLMGSISRSVNYSGGQRPVFFDRAAMVDVNVNLVLERINEFQQIDTDTIKSALASINFKIGENVYATRLICQVNATAGFYIKSITVNGSESINIGVRQCAQIKIGDVEVLIE